MSDTKYVKVSSESEKTNNEEAQGASTNNSDETVETKHAVQSRTDQVFNKFDANKDGVLDRKELRKLLEQHPEKLRGCATIVVDNLLEAYDANKDEQLNRDEFEQAAKTHRWIVNQYFKRYCSFVAPQMYTMEDEIEFCPPPLGILIISVIQMICFVVLESKSEQTCDVNQNSTSTGFGSYDLIYSSDQRKQVWRFLSYMFVHGSVLHIATNLFVQIFLGIPLEYVHSWWRVMIVYLAGILSGSLGVSIIQPECALRGASAGGYALLFAYFPTFVLGKMKNRVLYLLVFIICLALIALPAILTDNKFLAADCTGVSHIAHFCGAAAGLLFGMSVLKSTDVKAFQTKMQWMATMIFYSLITATVLIHVFMPSHFPSC